MERELYTFTDVFDSIIIIAADLRHGSARRISIFMLTDLKQGFDIIISGIKATENLQP